MNALIGDPRTFEKKSTMDKLSVDMMMGAAVTVIIYGTRFKVYYYKYKQLLAFNTFNFFVPLRTKRDTIDGSPFGQLSLPIVLTVMVMMMMAYFYQ